MKNKSAKKTLAGICFSVLAIALLSFVLFAQFSEADVAVTYNFKNSAGQQVTGVTVLRYVCANEDCSQVVSETPETFYSNSQSSLTINYPRNRPSKYNYAVYFFSNGYLPKSSSPSWRGTGSVSSDVTFNKGTQCSAVVDDFSVVNEVEPYVPVIINIKAANDASTSSAFYSVDRVPYYKPQAQQYKDFYSAQTKITVSIKDQSGNSVAPDQVKTVNLYKDAKEDVQFTWTPSTSGKYKVSVLAEVIDTQCESKLDSKAEREINVLSTKPTGKCYAIINNVGTSNPNPVIFPADQFTFSGKLITNYMDSSGKVEAVPGKVYVSIYTTSTGVIEGPAAEGTNSNLVYSFPAGSATAANDFTINWPPAEPYPGWAHLTARQYTFKLTAAPNDAAKCAAGQTTDAASIDINFISQSVLQKTARFSVVDSITQQAIPGVVITLTSAGGTPSQATTGPNGKANITGLLPGTYAYTAVKAGYPNATKTVNIQGDADFTISMEKQEFELSVNVFDQVSGTPVSGANVILTYAAKTYDTKTTNANGLAKFIHLLQGQYNIGISKSGYLSQSQVYYAYSTNTINIYLTKESSTTPGQPVEDAGCQYHNPDCLSGYTCQNNQCIQDEIANNDPVGCAYNNPACPSGQQCVDNICIAPGAIQVPPVIQPIENITVLENTPITIVVDASDENMDTLSYGATGTALQQSGASFNFFTHTFTWTPGFNTSGSYYITFEVYDGTTRVYKDVKITVDNSNRAPTIDSPVRMIAQENGTQTFMIAADDDDAEDTLAFTISNKPSFVSYTQVARSLQFTAAPTFADAGQYNITITVADDFGASASTYVEISVGETNRPPVLSPIGAKTVVENSTLTFPVNGSDPDSDNLVYSAFLPASMSKIMTAGDTSNVSISGTDYTINVVGVNTDANTAMMTVNGESKQMAAGETAKLGGLNVYIRQIFTYTVPAKQGAVELLLDANLPANAILNTTTKTFTWTPDFTQAGDYNITFTVNDGSLSASEIVPITVTNLNRIPQVILTAPNGGETWSALLNHTIAWNATDIDSDTLSIKLFYSNDSGATWHDTELATTNDGTEYLDVQNYPDLGTYRIKVVANDSQSTAEYSSDADFSIDNTAATTLAYLNGALYDGSWQTADFNINLNATDGIATPAYINYTYANNSEVSVPGNYATVSINQEGTKNLSFFSVDNLDNKEPVQTIQARLDKTPPTASDNAPAGWRISPFTFNITASDAASGIAKITYSNGTDKFESASSPVMITINQDGNHTFTYNATDNAGLNSSTNAVTVQLDVVAPSVNIVDSEIIIGMDFLETSVVSDATSGIAALVWSMAEGPGAVSFGTPDQANTTMNASADGVYKIRLTATDVAGNSAYDEFNLTWDTQNPTLLITSALSGSTNSNSIPVTITFSKNISDFNPANITDVVVSNGAVNESSVVNGAKVFTFDVVPAADGDVNITVPAGAARDEAGNTNPEVTFGIVSDRTAPVITLSGANPQAIQVGTAYTELNATAVDNYDGDITTSISIDASAVNTIVVGPYNVTYDVTDSSGNAAVQVQRTVSIANDIPVANNDEIFTNEEISVSFDILANDTDFHQSQLTASLITDVTNGTLTFNLNGTILYTPNTDFTGLDSFTYVANDGMDNSSVATVAVTVNPVNDIPVAMNDEYTTAEDTLLTVIAADGLLANDTDVELSALTAVNLTGTANGSLTLNPDGSFTYNPNANFFGIDTFTYVANDGTADSNTATVTINVAAVNDVPVSANDEYSTTEDVALNITSLAGVLANDTDADNNPLTAVIDVDVINGTLALNADGSFDYQPDANFFGTDSFTYHANDGTADSNIATVTINVYDVSPPSTSSDYNGAWNGVDFTINLNAADTASGVAYINYTYNGGAETSTPGNSTLVSINVEGNKTLAYFAVDNVGNKETTHTISVALDKTTPTIAITQPNGNLFNGTSTMQIDFTITDVSVSACSYTIDTTTTSASCIPGAQSLSVPIASLTDGQHSLTINATDAIGRENISNTVYFNTSTAGVLSGVVKNNATGLGISGVTIQVKQGGSIVNETTTESDGSYATRVAPGDYTIFAIKSGFIDASQTKTIQLATSNIVNFNLTSAVTAGNISGVVTDSLGNKMYGATVQFKQSGSLINQTTTNDTGYYSQSLEAGNYDVYVFKPGFVDNSSLGVSVTPATSITSNLGIAQSNIVAGSISGTIYNSTFDFIDARIEIRKTSNQELVQVVHSSAADGTFTATGLLTTSTYDLKAIRSPYVTITFATGTGVTAGGNSGGRDALMS